jgi:hypothetical protein
MKMVKSLLLGSAAGLVAVTAGQAADLPVKAKPVEYVKICSLYGAGFYYMPGTDMCIKIGGWVRAEARGYINGNSTTGIMINDLNQRATNNFWTRERGYITADVREMTPYGVARGYIAVGVSAQNSGGEAPSGQFSANRAFVQWAGITAGESVSFYDFYPAAAFLISAGQIPSEDTGDAGWWVWGYTAQLGNGFSATISAEERRIGQIIGQSTADTLTAGLQIGAETLPWTAQTTGAGYGGWQSPDIIGNIRVDQAWGGAQIMAAAHEVNADYYGVGGGTDMLPVNGHPSDQWGFAAGVGLKINFPMIAQGDYFDGEFNYTQGAASYAWNGAHGGNQSYVSGNTIGYAVGSDCVYGGSPGTGNNTSCNLTTVWNFNAAYEHYWTPQWHQSIAGGYYQERYNAQANAILCSLEAGGNGAGIGSMAVATPGCNNNWSLWGVGSRLQWDVTKNLYVSGEVVYDRLNSASTFNGLGYPALLVAGSGLNGSTTINNQSNWLYSVRLHKDFLP